MSPDLSVKGTQYPENIHIVSSMREFSEADFTAKNNVVLFPRVLTGDFNAVTMKILSRCDNDNFLRFDDRQGNFGFDQFFQMAQGLYTPEALAALEQIARDVEFLKSSGYLPQIRVQRENLAGRAHVDGSVQGPVHRVLANYSGATTLGWAQEDVMLDMTQNPVRIKFQNAAKPFSMGLGSIWKQMTISHPLQTPFVHNVPVGNDQPRMLLVADPGVS